MILQFIEVVLHLDKYLLSIANQYLLLAYALLFLIVFFETGIVVTPFLPGDSLLFAAGALSAAGVFQLGFVFALIFVAAVAGDALNYNIGKYIGPKIFTKKSSFFFHRRHLVKAQKFYEKHGKKTIILARFIPIVRTFAPFVAGIGDMPYRVFLIYNVVGAALWCSVFILGGYFFGSLPWVKENFSLLILGIIGISLLPVATELAHLLIDRIKKRE